MKKYLILDFGNVLAYPVTGYWFITPLFLDMINSMNLDKEKILLAMKEYNYILSRKVSNLEEEYKMFYDFYDLIFKKIGYKMSGEDIGKISFDITYNDDKYKFYDDVKSELKRLSKKYKLLMLSDNWPCAIRIMKNEGIYDYFDKVYISSFYGEEKKNKIFFDFPINEYNILKGEAIFVDDNEALLDIAISKNFSVLLMDRDNNMTSKHKIINSLLDL